MTPSYVFAIMLGEMTIFLSGLVIGKGLLVASQLSACSGSLNLSLCLSMLMHAFIYMY